jgi:hypothetical protein
MQLQTIGIDLGKTLFHLVGLNQRGAIEGRPILAYISLNRGLNSCSASSVMVRSERSGWSCGTRCSGLI